MFLVLPFLKASMTTSSRIALLLLYWHKASISKFRHCKNLKIGTEVHKHEHNSPLPCHFSVPNCLAIQTRLEGSLLLNRFSTPFTVNKALQKQPLISVAWLEGWCTNADGIKIHDATESYVDTQQEDAEMNFKLDKESFIHELSDIFLFFLTRIEEHRQKLLRNISTAHIYLSIFSLSPHTCLSTIYRLIALMIYIATWHLQ